MKTEQRICQLLKTEGPMTAQAMSETLGLTSMGVRQHLLRLAAAGELGYEDKKAERGRPTRYWHLTEKSDHRFPDAHEGLTLQLIDSVKAVFGEAGLDQLVAQREQDAFEAYSKELEKHTNLMAKLKVLAKLRCAEGYMASIKQDGDVYWLLENHCSICAAASHCLNFCRSELQLFQSLLQDLAAVEREEHIMAGARRCAYRVTPLL